MAVSLALSAGCRSPLAGKKAAAPGPVIVCLGDSITEGLTYALLVRQSLREAGRTEPVMLGAGVGGDTAGGMLARLDRDVFSYDPDLVMLDTGLNDYALTAGEYEQALRAIYDRCKAEKVPVLSLTLTTLAPRHSGMDAHLAEFDAVIRRLAAEYGWALADVQARMREALARGGEELNEPDGVHLNLAGYRAMARAVLDAMGHGDVPVCETFVPPLLPGVVPLWRTRALAEGETFDPAAADPGGEGWTDLRLPRLQSAGNWWLDQERQRGVAVRLDQVAGAGAGYASVAELDEPAAREAWLCVGADMKQAWLNGEPVYGNTEPRGWYPGRARIPVSLREGRNLLAVTSGSSFFAAVLPGRLDLDQPRPVRVACVGDSLTSGFKMEHPGRDGYPARLGRILGDGFEVRPFAVPGRTALRDAGLPLWKEPCFETAQAWNPEIVVLCLGANDCWPAIWQEHGARFPKDLADMVRLFQGLPSRPRVFLAPPTPMFIDPGRNAVQLRILSEEVVPLVRAVAEETGCVFLDWHTPLRGRAGLFLEGDGVHPTPEGAAASPRRRFP
jgi:acyl-CoA thioesterase-1